MAKQETLLQEISREVARAYHYFHWLTHEDMSRLITGKVTAEAADLTDDFTADVLERLDFEVTRGSLGPRVKPREFLSWGDTMDLQLAEGFRARASPPSLSAPPRQPRVDLEDDKTEVRSRAKKIWQIHPNHTLVQVENDPLLAPYKAKYRGKNTITEWIRNLNPSRGKRGRRPSPHRGRGQRATKAT